MRWPGARSAFMLVATTVAGDPPGRARRAAVASWCSATRDVGDLPDRGARAVGVHQPRARLRPAARRRASAHLRDRLADQRRAHDRRLRRARGRARQAARAACCSATTAPRRSCCWGCGGRCASACARAAAAAPPALPSALAALLRFGLPTVPAEASVYALSLVDRYYIFHSQSQPLAGLYSIAVKLAGAVAFIVRAFQYAWPPLAYSITDDARGRALLRPGHHLLRGGQRLGRGRAGAARALGHAAAGRARSSTPTRRCRGSRWAGRCTGCGWCSW